MDHAIKKTFSLLSEKGDKNDKGERVRLSSTPSPPPSYQADQLADYDLSASIRKLNLAANSTSVSSNARPTNDECIAHLKLLASFAQLCEEISETDGVLGLGDNLAEGRDNLKFSNTLSQTSSASMNTSRALEVPPIAKIREKRWAVYITRAVDRFQKWWETLLPGCGREPQLQMNDCVTPDRLQSLLRTESALRWRADMLPPLDVLMVLHSFMLNPRNFLEDCLRFGMVPVWLAGFPWDLVNASIDNRRFEYSPPEEAVARFTSKTGLDWDNLQDPMTRSITCPNCKKTRQHVYTDGNYGYSSDKAFEGGMGYADKSFESQCRDCGLVTNHQSLCLDKFHDDVQRLLNQNIPMPGTILSIEGTPESTTTSEPTKHEVFFPNRLILAGLHATLLEISKPDLRSQGQGTVDSIRKTFEKGLKDRSLVSSANSKVFSRTIKRSEKIAIRRMMSKYWENSTPFALDLAGAVLRQGTFVNKMKAIDWIQSPALENTMSRLIEKYINFFKIIERNPGRVAVPTLDVDLAWHTHQLTPNAYFQYSVAHANGQFIDHDDKIDENVLSNSFEWTSKQYQKITGGEVYSECTCWYCEAIREAHHETSLFSSKKASSNEKALALHDRKDISADPAKNPHISAHNAVKAESLAASRIARYQALKLDSDYHRAVKRARKAGKEIPDRNAYTTNYVWGYPMYMPMYGGLYLPYAADPGISGNMYACNPGCMAMNPGAVGNCVAGACGGGVGSGGSGACAGGSAGGCGGGTAGGGGCAGGGGGGCGGGGGGGGCGGGGGGA